LEQLLQGLYGVDAPAVGWCNYWRCHSAGKQSLQQTGQH